MVETPAHIKAIMEKKDPLLARVHDLIVNNLDVLNYVARKSLENKSFLDYAEIEIEFRHKLKDLKGLIKAGLLLEPSSIQNRAALTFIGLLYTDYDLDLLKVYDRIYEMVKRTYINTKGRYEIPFKSLLEAVYTFVFTESDSEVQFLLECTETAPIRVFEFSKVRSVPINSAEEVMQISYVKAGSRILEFENFEAYVYACKESAAQRYDSLSRTDLLARAVSATDYFAQYTLPNKNLNSNIPNEIIQSLENFKRDYPDQPKVGFIMMEFNEKHDDSKILKNVKDVLDGLGLKGIRADEKEYHGDLFWNVMTYIYGCGFGIAIYEKIEVEVFNPNISLEVGAMFALRKEVCILKENNLKKIPTDIIGKLYRPFSLENFKSTGGHELKKWLSDKSIV